MNKAITQRLLGLQVALRLGLKALAGVVALALCIAAAPALRGIALSPVTTATTASTPTTTKLTSSSNSSVYGESVSFTATVASSGSAPPNGESVSFLSGKTVLGTSTLYGGSANYSTSALAAGSYSITAKYGGDASFAASTSNVVSQKVSKAATTTALTSSEDPINLGQSVILTAFVAATATWEDIGPPTGAVTFSYGSTKLGTATLSGDAASIATSALPLGASSIKAVYGGDSNFAGSTSIAVSQTVVDTGAPAFTTFDVPGAGAGPHQGSATYQGTAAFGIDAAGDVTGTYVDAKGVAHGFFRAANGNISTFNAPGAGTGTTPSNHDDPYYQGTIPIGINSSGKITGTYIGSKYDYHGFVRATDGKINTFDVTDDITGTSQAQGTRPVGINAAGEIVGTYTSAPWSYSGFVRAVDGKITTFNAPGAVGGTLPLSIDGAGDVAGTYLDANGQSHGFLLPANGTISKIDIPGAGGSGECLYPWTGTIPMGTDAAGNLTGNYVDANSVRHGFVRTAGGTITTFTAPAAGTGTLLNVGCPLAGTVGVAINMAGTITGMYLDADAVYHGFVRTAKGAMTTFDAPGAGTGALQGTGGLSINDTGVIAGTYLDGNTVAHGFVFNSTSLVPTATTLSSSTASSVFGEPVTFTAKVVSSEGAPPNGGTVYFMHGAKTVGTGMLSGGEASFTTTALPVGAGSITAAYGGEVSFPGGPNFAGSTSNAVSQKVGAAASTTALVSSPNPSNSGQSVTLTANVTGQFGGRPTGSMTFKDGTTALKTVTLSAGVAKFTTSSLAKGKHNLTAAYDGNSNFAGSSGAVTQTVN